MAPSFRKPSRTTVTAGIYALTAAAATAAGASGNRTLAAWTKPLPMLVLGAATVPAVREHGTAPADAALLAGAIGFSAAGDRAMLLEEFGTDDAAKERHLAIGAGLFAGAQASLCGLLARRGARVRAKTLTPRMVLLGESAAILAVKNRPALTVLGPYGNSLAVMSALASDAPNPQPALRAGGLLFVLSDLAIINRRYLLTGRRSRTAAEAWVLGSYFAAQWLLVTSLSKPLR
ncbi:lysoplasmalogenase [Gordonia amarae]|uniref:YhhN-like protein n=2 Tax=Gordonia amarae TaxID=36821 RepID=G7GV86_9ACTN|nr:lysoplasmalogenase family protein [Gordonia amarae]MCS3879977.1 putative membrane protein YhhN [Gordonia amarae]QHN18368.1 lysoplasmalogenase [Gordonia amarae]QHN22850.1 lysoplasmalogenase [Gordonia amarae]QHN31753.1 lysoplasmalogenase [Gordonia amarae]QHN40499.1 lysoplasmalogenase [Gordonia amarae]